MQLIEDVKALLATLPDGDYRLNTWSCKKYGIHRRASYITVRDGKLVAKYEDLWCGSPVSGETYRTHRNGRMADYPKRLDTAVDFTEQWALFLENYPDLETDDVLAQLTIERTVKIGT